MKTRRIPSVEATLDYLYERVRQGDVIHGSPYVDLETLRATETKFLHVDDKTGQRVVARRIVAATGLSEAAPGLTPIIVSELAIFYAAVHAVMRDSGIKGSTSTRSIRNEGANIIGYNLFLDDRGKRYITEREQAGGVSAVYLLKPDGFIFNPDDQEYTIGHSVQAIESVEVTSAHLLRGIENLPEPESDPMIAAYRARYRPSIQDL